MSPVLFVLKVAQFVLNLIFLYNSFGFFVIFIKLFRTVCVYVCVVVKCLVRLLSLFVVFRY